ncbi:family 1 glycosylhydrolase [Sphingomonas sp. CFBP 13720]|nr:family 1 glycosylhydrolase [Sphingomonas sp. CFBP 13720]
MTPDPRSPLELWGGVECTVNRVGDRYRDQSVLSGHHDRIGDLDLFAGLGLKALRYPVLWERTAATPDAPPDWSWSDARLARLQALGIRPIVGLVHHGSGPSHTHLLDDDFAAGLGRFAGQVAARYPWVQDWTPVNEPVTTARFSALYGHWYPHRRDLRSFWLALLNQVDATRFAMRAIRRVNPAARLIQTDDLGRTYSTDPLRDQAAFDNLRRWAGWDLLFGHVTPGHPLFAMLDDHGFGDRIRAIADDPCPPDIVGVNHYLTSDRFLDHRLAHYPTDLHGDNGHVRYADTEAIRVLDPPPGGMRQALSEAWDRYATPIAATEVHNGCTRDEQLRWAADAWDLCCGLKADGVDVRAVTAWSLLGSHGWDTLLTGNGSYEVGVFDVRNGIPQPTALAALWRGLALGDERHPVARQSGWWRRPERLLYPAYRTHPAADAGEVIPDGGTARPIRLWGVDAGSRRTLADLCARRGIHLGSDAVTGTPTNDAMPWAVVHLERDAGSAVETGTAALTWAGGAGDVRHLRIVAPAGECPDVFRTVADAALDILIDDRAGHWSIRICPKTNGIIVKAIEPARQDDEELPFRVGAVAQPA